MCMLSSLKKVNHKSQPIVGSSICSFEVHVAHPKFGTAERWLHPAQSHLLPRNVTGLSLIQWLHFVQNLPVGFASWKTGNGKNCWWHACSYGGTPAHHVALVFSEGKGHKISTSRPRASQITATMATLWKSNDASWMLIPPHSFGNPYPEVTGFFPFVSWLCPSLSSWSARVFASLAGSIRLNKPWPWSIPIDSSLLGSINHWQSLASLYSNPFLSWWPYVASSCLC